MLTYFPVDQSNYDKTVKENRGTRKETVSPGNDISSSQQQVSNWKLAIVLWMAKFCIPWCTIPFTVIIEYFFGVTTKSNTSYSYNGKIQNKFSVQWTKAVRFIAAICHSIKSNIQVKY